MGQDRGVDAGGDLAQAVEAAAGVTEGPVQGFPGPLRRGRPVLLGELKVDDRAHQLLLGAVVQVTGDSLPRGVEGGDHARPRGDQLSTGGRVRNGGADQLGEARNPPLSTRRQRLVLVRADDQGAPAFTIHDDGRAHLGFDAEFA